MCFIKSRRTVLVLCLLVLTNAAVSLAENNPLPSWNDGQSKAAIISFVTSVTDESNADYVPPAERIAVFDNDGTLWSEKPLYFQLLFAIDRVKQLAPEHPEWQTTQPYQAVLEGDATALSKAGGEGLLELIAATHSGMTTDEFTAIVKEWVNTAEHPTLHRPYTQLVFQPMLELLDYLRANGFATYIVSGGSIDFMRPWAQEVYGIPPEQVIGSSAVTKFEMRDGKPVIIRTAETDFINDNVGKPVGINLHIGCRPIFAFGNSDGDLQMLQWTTLAVQGKRFGGLVHHTDADREFAYDRNSSIGKLDKALAAAQTNGWTVVDMEHEWKIIYPFEKKEGK